MASKDLETMKIEFSNPFKRKKKPAAKPKKKPPAAKFVPGVTDAQFLADKRRARLTRERTKTSVPEMDLTLQPRGEMRNTLLRGADLAAGTAGVVAGKVNRAASAAQSGGQKAGSFLGRAWDQAREDLGEFYGDERLRDIPGKLAESAMGLASPDVRKKWQGASDAIVGRAGQGVAEVERALKGTGDDAIQYWRKEGLGGGLRKGVDALKSLGGSPAMPAPLEGGVPEPLTAKYVPPKLGPGEFQASGPAGAMRGQTGGDFYPRSEGSTVADTRAPRFVPSGRGGSYAGNTLSAAQREFQRKRGLYAGPESSFQMEQRAIGGVNALTVSDRNRKAMAQKQLVRDYQGMANEAQTMREQLAGQKDIASIAGGVEQTKNMIEFAKTQVAVIVQRMKQGESIPPQVQASIEALKANPLMPEAEAAKHYQNIASFSQSPQGGQGAQGGGADANQNGVEDKDEEAMRNAKDPEWSKANPIKAQAIITYNKKKYPQIYGK